MEILTTVEVLELETLEDIIEGGLKSFYEMGVALKTIRDNRLYRKDFGTFEDYCQTKWKLNKSHSYRLIDSSEVISDLSPIGDKLPETESQTRPLTILKTAEERIAVWSQVVEKHGDNITAKHVSEEVANYRGVVSDVKDNASLEYRIVSYLGPKYYTVFQNIKKNMECSEAELVRQFVKEGIENTDSSYKRPV